MKNNIIELNKILQEKYNQEFGKEPDYKCRFLNFLKFDTIEVDDNGKFDLRLNGNVIDNVDLLELLRVTVCLYSCFKETDKPPVSEEAVNNDND